MPCQEGHPDASSIIEHRGLETMSGTTRMSGPEVLALARRLKTWADETRSKDAVALVADLPDVYAAARVVVECVDRLLADPPLPGEEQAQLLVDLQAWLYDEMLEHIQRLRRPLEAVLTDLHA